MWRNIMAAKHPLLGIIEQIRIKKQELQEIGAGADSKHSDPKWIDTMIQELITLKQTDEKEALRQGKDLLNKLTRQYDAALNAEHKRHEGMSRERELKSSAPKSQTGSTKPETKQEFKQGVSYKKPETKRDTSKVYRPESPKQASKFEAGFKPESKMGERKLEVKTEFPEEGEYSSGRFSRSPRSEDEFGSPRAESPSPRGEGGIKVKLPEAFPEKFFVAPRSANKPAAAKDERTIQNVFTVLEDLKTKVEHITTDPAAHQRIKQFVDVIKKQAKDPKIDMDQWKQRFNKKLSEWNTFVIASGQVKGIQRDQLTDLAKALRLDEKPHSPKSPKTPKSPKSPRA